MNSAPSIGQLSKIAGESSASQIFLGHDSVNLYLENFSKHAL